MTPYGVAFRTQERHTYRSTNGHCWPLLFFPNLFFKFCWPLGSVLTKLILPDTRMPCFAESRPFVFLSLLIYFSTSSNRIPLFCHDDPVGGRLLDLEENVLDLEISSSCSFSSPPHMRSNFFVHSEPSGKKLSIPFSPVSPSLSLVCV